MESKFSRTQACSLIASCLLLSACTTVETVPVAGPPATLTLVSAHDAAATIHLKCDNLGFYRGSDGSRLCVMRGIDQLRVEAEQPKFGCYYPPCVPSGVPLIGGAAVSPAPATVFIR